MLRLMLVLSVALCLSVHASDPLYEEIHGNGVYTTSQVDLANRRLAAVRRDWERGRLEEMARETNLALRGLFKIAVLNLRWHGYKAEAKKLEAEWKQHDGELIHLVSQRDRKIGDFEPLSMWLAVAYAALEEKLGYDVCRLLRLSDLHTFNYTIKVVFSPCQYGLTEFEYHFVHDDPTIFHPYKGFAPVTAYWLSVITCSVATYGAGYFFICSPIGMLVERGMDGVVAPWLAPKVFEWACN